MITEPLRHIFSQLEQLPEEAQNRLATIIQEHLEEGEEQEWAGIVGKPRVRDALRRLAAEARQQEIAGDTEEGGWER